MIQMMMEWLAGNQIEVLGAILGIAYIFFFNQAKHFNLAHLTFNLPVLYCNFLSVKILC